MSDIERQLVEALQSGRAVVLCKLIETRGSTPQKAGARMLVFADGSQAGTLGGGCVEADVRRQALRALQNGQPLLADFLLDDNYGWDDGLICGGRIKVMVDPLIAERDLELFQTLQKRTNSRQSSLLATVFDSDPEDGTRFLGSKRLLTPAGHLLTAAGDWPAAKDPLRRESALTWAQAGVLYELLVPPTKLVILGAGHIGRVLARLATELDFEVHVIDDRAKFASPERFPEGTQCVVGDVGPAVDQFPADDRTFFVIVTRGHQHDEEALYHALRRPSAYVGMIGSKRKVKLIFDDLRSLGITDNQLAAVHAPIGLDIGSQTVAEIAVSIAAELIQVRQRVLTVVKHVV